jgi:glc operon protein GlcG
MTTRFVTSIVLAALLAGMSGASAQIESRFSLQASAAQEMILACEAFAGAQGGAVNIWVVNLLGQPLGFARMDGANPWTGDWAHMKAVTAVEPSNPSSSRIAQMERRGVTQGTGMYYQLEHFPRAGGVPVMVDDKPIGAIGVEGLGPDQDEACAEAGVSAIGHLFTN